MAEWKTRGYVPDSEDESDDESFPCEEVQSTAAEGHRAEKSEVLSSDGMLECQGNDSNVTNAELSVSEAKRGGVYVEVPVKNVTPRQGSSTETIVLRSEITHGEAFSKQLPNSREHEPEGSSSTHNITTVHESLSEHGEDVENDTAASRLDQSTASEDHHGGSSASSASIEGHTTPLSAVEDSTKQGSALLNTLAAQDSIYDMFSDDESSLSSIASKDCDEEVMKDFLPMIPRKITSVASNNTESIIATPSSQDATKSQPEMSEEGGSKTSTADQDVATEKMINEEPQQQSRYQLRKPNPLASHPYTIDAQIYRQMFKRAGLQPVRFEFSSHETRRRNQADSQDSDFEELDRGTQLSAMTKESSDSEIDELQELPLPPVFRVPRGLRSVPRARESFEARSTGNEDELSSIDAILRRPLPGQARNGFKRRRLEYHVSGNNRTSSTNTQSFSAKKARQSNLLTPHKSSSLPPDDVENNTAEKTHKNEPVYMDDEIKFPTTPDESSPAFGIKSDSKFHVPYRLSPRRLRTSTSTTSTLQSRDMPTGTTIVATNDEDSSLSASSNQSASDGTSSEEEEVQLQKVQRKIKGVLPASWLKLDLKKQLHQRKDKQMKSKSPSRSPHRRGVARKTRRSIATRPDFSLLNESTAVPNKSYGMDVFSLMSPERDEWEQRSSKSFDEPLRLDYADDDDVIEEDHIDPMLPTKPRRLNGYSVPRKRQTNLPDQIVRIQSKRTHHITRSKSDGPPRKQPKITAHLRTQSGYPVTRNGFTNNFQADIHKIPTKRTSKRARRTRSANVPLNRVTSETQSRFPSTNAERINRHIKTNSTSSTDRGSPDVPDEQSYANRVANHLCENRFTHAHWHLTSGICDGHALRTAQCEAEAPVQDIYPIGRSQRVPFAQGLRPLLQKADGNLTLSKFLEDEDDAGPSYTERHSSRSNTSLDEDSDTGESDITETPSRYINVQAKNFASASKITPRPSKGNILARSRQNDIGTENFASLSMYPIHFDTVPLRSGTFFHGSMLLGNNDFARSLSFTSMRNLDVLAGFSEISLEADTCRCSSWDETTLSSITLFFTSGERMLDDCQDDHLDTNVNLQHIRAVLASFLKSLIRYFNQSLNFLDPVDRSQFLERLLALLTSLWKNVPKFSDESIALQELSLSLSVHVLVISNQLLQISQSPLVDSGVQKELLSLVYKVAEYICLACTTTHALGRTRRMLEENKQSSRFETGIGDVGLQAASLVIVLHIYERLPEPRQDLFQFINSGLIQSHGIDFKTIRNVDALEQVWENVYTLLPLNEFDEIGVLRHERRFQAPFQNWQVIKDLINCVFNIYANRSETYSMSGYIRTLYNRCLNLIVEWNWWNSQSIIETLFDFFARRKLSNLKNEESRGSPKFLAELDKNPSLTCDRVDITFHILLKIVGAGMKAMIHNNVSDKKLSNLVWRLLPNHGRQLSREEDVLRSDLDALRNHHDMLCVLYWASPPKSRPRISTIQELVEPASSHKEACHISMRAWTNLVKFQLSADENYECLRPFADWHDDFSRQVLQQHILARTEAQAQSDSFSNAGFTVPVSVVEKNIEANQRQVEAVLCHALSSLKVAIGSSARDAAAINMLLTKSSVCDIFQLFDVSNSRVNSVINEALDVIMTSITTCNRLENRTDSSALLQDSEDSQETYDLDTSVFDYVIQQENSHDESPSFSKHLLDTVHDPLARLLSNAFGSDKCPDDLLLEKLVDTWVSVARILIRDGLKDWQSYLDNRGSWGSLRDTDQKRKFAAYFLAGIIQADPQYFKKNKPLFLNSWMKALVERESILKYQHQLTTAILNSDPNDPLVHNVPFITNGEINQYLVSATQFRQRRVMLISTLLSNMRASLDELSRADFLRGTQSCTGLANQYREMLQTLMTAMKSNYLELGVEASTAKGSYVAFVHRVIELLQEHASDCICDIDRFFTESSAFPLPATDPNYLIGKLKRYGNFLSDPQKLAPKQFIVFVLSTSERVTLEKQQDYLVKQLSEALSNVPETGNAEQPSLRAFMLNAILPAYMSQALCAPAAWILARPLLQFGIQAYHNLMFEFDIMNPKTTRLVTRMCSSLFSAVGCLLSSISESPHLLKKPETLGVLDSVFATATEALLVVDYIDRMSSPQAETIKRIRNLQNFGAWTAKFLLGESDVEFCQSQRPENNEKVEGDDDDEQAYDYSQLVDIAKSEFTTLLSRSWHVHENRYFCTKGPQTHSVDVSSLVKSFDEAKEGLLSCIVEFEKVLNNMCFTGRDIEDGFQYLSNAGRGWREVEDEAFFFLS